MAEKTKIFFGMNSANYAMLTGAGGGPSLFGALLNQLEGIDYEIVLLSETEPVTKVVEDVEIIIPGVTHISADVINAAKKLKAIVQPGVGLDMVDIEAATKRGIPVVNEPEGSSAPMGEFAVLMILGAMRKVQVAQGLMKQGVMAQPTTMELSGRTLGLIGLGRSAKELAKRMQGFDMKMIGIDKFPEAGDGMGLDFVGGMDQLDYILANADVISLHCPMNEETMGMINYDTMSKMKRTAILVNQARAGIIEREGFIKAMKENKIMGAALDVFWQEPVDPADELFTLPTVFCTPHIATSTMETRIRLFTGGGRSIKMILNGQRPKSQVNL